MIFTTSDGVRLHYQLQGGGKAIVLLHGWSGNHSNFAPIVEELSKTNTVLCYDHRGHGFSDHPQYGLTLSTLAQDLEELLEHLDLKDILLIGWSMGAMTFFDYVQQFGTGRLRGSIIIDMTPKLMNDKEWELGLYDGEYKKEDSDRDLTQMFSRFDIFFADFSKKALPYATDELLLEMAKLAEASGIPPASLLALCGLWHAMGQADYREVIKKIDVPTKIFRGAVKSLYSRKTAEYLAEHISGSEIVEFEQCTHMLVVENPKKVLEEIQAFSKEVG